VYFRHVKDRASNSRTFVSIQFFLDVFTCYLFIFNDYSASFPVTELNRLDSSLLYDFASTFFYKFVSIWDYTLYFGLTLWFTKSICYWRLKCYSEWFCVFVQQLQNWKCKMYSHWFMCYRPGKSFNVSIPSLKYAHPDKSNICGGMS